MAEFTIQKGFDINLAGKPAPEVADALSATTSILYPLEFVGLKQRLKLREGDRVKRGQEIMEDKRDERFKLRAPAGGTIREIVRGERRFVNQVVIDMDSDAGAEQFRSYTSDSLRNADQGELLSHLRDTGYLAYIMQRPFGKLADISLTPKSIFVNAMNTGPFQADANVVVADDPQAFQSGLDMLTRLTDGAVHVCVGANANESLRAVKNVQVHTFCGPHPSGNTSVHIARIHPMKPTDVVWTSRAVDLVLVGRLLLDGEFPTSRIVAVGGNGVCEGAARHYRMKLGGLFSQAFSGAFKETELRWIQGDILSGIRINPGTGLRFYQSSLTVIPEGRERRFLGWMAPGFDLLSFMRTYASAWLGGGRTWSLNTNRNGGHRAMLLTGQYDKVMPLNIMVDYLVRAVLANDTDEAIELGILETLPEDFALCDFICPSKTEVQQIIARGLAAIEEEGI